MKHSPILLVCVLALAACTANPPAVNHAMEHDVAAMSHDMAQMHMQHGSLPLAVHLEEGAAPDDLAFSIRHGNEIFADYGTSHTKEMHLLLVRDDLTHFSHLHPRRDDGGVWHHVFEPEAGGTYWLYADFVDGGGAAYTPKAAVVFEGDAGTHGLKEDFARARTVGGYMITMLPSLSGTTATFDYAVTDANGNAVEVEEYLAAKGHSILFTKDGGFLHAHAMDQSLVFTTDVAPGTFYRMYTQFQIEGEVVTVSFDWQAP